MKLGTPVGSFFRLGPNSEMPTGSAIFNFNMAVIFNILLPITMKLRQTNVISVPTSSKIISLNLDSKMAAVLP